MRHERGGGNFDADGLLSLLGEPGFVSRLEPTETSAPGKFSCYLRGIGSPPPILTGLGYLVVLPAPGTVQLPGAP